MNNSNNETLLDPDEMERRWVLIREADAAEAKRNPDFNPLNPIRKRNVYDEFDWAQMKNQFGPERARELEGKALAGHWEWKDFYPEKALPININKATHIGTLKLNLKKEFPDGNLIEYEPFENGSELVRLMGNNKYIFKKDTLQELFDYGRVINPITEDPLTIDQVERFTYRYIGGKRTKKTRKQYSSDSRSQSARRRQKTCRH
jgi:hypothetical protein